MATDPDPLDLHKGPESPVALTIRPYWEDASILQVCVVNIGGNPLVNPYGTLTLEPATGARDAEGEILTRSVHEFGVPLLMPGEIVALDFDPEDYGTIKLDGEAHRLIKFSSKIKPEDTLRVMRECKIVADNQDVRFVRALSKVADGLESIDFDGGPIARAIYSTERQRIKRSRLNRAKALTGKWTRKTRRKVITLRDVFIREPF